MSRGYSAIAIFIVLTFLGTYTQNIFLNKYWLSCEDKITNCSSSSGVIWNIRVVELFGNWYEYCHLSVIFWARKEKERPTREFILSHWSQGHASLQYKEFNIFTWKLQNFHFSTKIKISLLYCTLELYWVYKWHEYVLTQWSQSLTIIR